jgi:O-acetylserine/cysteine efflux transporter
MSLIDIILNFLINFLWGISYTATGYAMLYMTPMLVYGIRFILGGLISLPFSNFEKIDKKEWLRIIALCVFQMFEFVFLAIGMVHLDSSTSSIVARMSVPFTIVLDVIIFREKLQFSSVVGIIIGFIAMVVISGGVVATDIKYILLTLLSPFSNSFCSIISKKMKINNKLKTAVTSLVAGCFIILYSYFFEKNHIIAKFDYKLLLNLLYLALGCCYFCYTTFYYLLSKYNAAKVMPFSFLISVFSMLGGVVILGETINIQKIVGTVLILSSIFMTDAKFARGVKYMWLKMLKMFGVLFRRRNNTV